MKMVDSLIQHCSSKILHTLVKADLIRQLIVTLNPLSLHFPETVDIHTCLIYTIFKCFRLATPQGLEELKIEDENEQQTVRETVLRQVLEPSKKYISHLCVNRLSIIDGEQSSGLLLLLAWLVEMCPFYQQILELVVDMPVFLTIPSCLTFLENERSIWMVPYLMTDAQREWNKKGGNAREMGMVVHRVLRMEGIEDVLEGKMRNDKSRLRGAYIVDNSIDWNNLLGMNLSRRG
ncbi:hypothetical protein BLNAU_8485 [Blattamonas nauphoetae]|uniref:Uncharacterized protein n=1 Tax=Blattamonas nauphoetae TaxID=2049346 RepID=A0ABQ9XYV0_9EUKA|nr:hypothetical protein BLNAU_8485 [Blattamonas nauphoetae]